LEASAESAPHKKRSPPKYMPANMTMAKPFKVWKGVEYDTAYARDAASTTMGIISRGLGF
jgi:hypothetical protein